jgi:MFS family permease
MKGSQDVEFGTEKLRFPALYHRDFRILWIGMLFASGTLAFQYYAQMWLVYSITGSGWILGGLGAVRGIATLIFGLYGGALADRMDRRKLLFVTETVALLVAALLGLLVVSGITSLPLIFLLIFIGAAAGSIDAPIRQALIPELVPPRHIPNAVALTTAAMMGSFAITPILAGLVIDGIGPGGAYLVSTLGNIGILIALLMLRYRGEARAARHESVLATIRTGLSWIRGQSALLWIVLVSFVTGAFGFALFHGVIAKWAGEVLGMSPGQYGMLAATWGVGTLCASYFMSWKGDIERHGRIFVIASLLFGLSFLAFGLARSIPLAGLAYIINGAAWTAAGISGTALVQKIVPNEVRGRVMSIFMLSGAVAQINAILLGFGADIVGIQALLIGTTLLCTIVVLIVVLCVPSLRHLDRVIDKNV